MVRYTHKSKDPTKTKWMWGNNNVKLSGSPGNRIPGSGRLLATFGGSDVCGKESPGAKNISWTSSDESIATIDSNGKIIARKPGKVTITALTTNKQKSYCDIVITSQTKGKSIIFIKPAKLVWFFFLGRI